MLPVVGGFGPITATNASNPYAVLIPPKSNAYYTVINNLKMITPNNQQILYFMRPKGTTTVSVAAGGQKSVTIAADPGVGMKGPNGTQSQLADRGIAGNDYVVFILPDGTYWLDTVASVAAGPPIVLTMTTNLPTGGLAANATMWFFGLNTDSDPITGKAFSSLFLPKAATTNYGPADDGIARSFKRGEPMVVYCDNASAQGWLDGLSAIYSAV